MTTNEEREAAAHALEDAADAINRDFQSLPSWGESYRKGTRTQEWMTGGTRMTLDTIDWLRARAAAIRAAAPDHQAEAQTPEGEA